MKMWYPSIVALVIIISAGLKQGQMTERWGEFPELMKFAERINDVPRDIGDWKGTTNDQLDERIMNIAGYVKSLNRTYKKINSNEIVTVNIVCGRMGDVFTHTPDRCYPASGFSTVEEPSSQDVTFGPQDRFTAKFMSAKFLKSDRRISTPIRILWNFSSDGNWDAPKNPKFTFAGQHALYKVYIQHDNPGDGKATDALGKEFARVLLPALTKAFFPDSEAATALREAELKDLKEDSSEQEGKDAKDDSKSPALPSP